jgi:hypothetical protein
MSWEQHLLAIELLEKLGVANLRLEPDRHGRYRYVGWSLPLTVGSGSLPKSKCGWVSQVTPSRRHR